MKKAIQRDDEKQKGIDVRGREEGNIAYYPLEDERTVNLIGNKNRSVKFNTIRQENKVSDHSQTCHWMK